jgi:trans-L-3-hydroxyproline dehydratase
MYNFTNKVYIWNPPQDWRKITTIDTHTAGEPLRIITSGLPEIKGKTILEKRKYFQENQDDMRRILMWEPRGHADMYGCIITAPVTKEADFGIIFMHNEGYSTMCGHGIIAVTKVVIEIGLIEKCAQKTTVKIDSPAGLIKSTAYIKNSKVEKVSFQNVPSYVVALDKGIEIERIGKIKYDLAFGGAYYAYVQAKDVGCTCLPKDVNRLIQVGREIKKAVSKSFAIKHPYNENLNFLYGTIFIDEPIDVMNHSKNVCIFADGEVDRSPTGTGVSGRLAIHYAKNEISIGESISIESIIGTKFEGKVIQEVKFGMYNAIVPDISGTAYITGKNEFFIDPNDNIKTGFIIR